MPLPRVLVVGAGGVGGWYAGQLAAAGSDVTLVARGAEEAADLSSFNLGLITGRDMAVSFVSSDDVYRGVARAVAYGIMFIGIVFLATLIFEAVSGRKAHPAQYILVGHCEKWS